MSKLVILAKGGYKPIAENGEEISDGEIIPADRVIPFGRLHGFPRSTTSKQDVNLDDSSKYQNAWGLQEEVLQAAFEYANKMKAPFFELDQTVQNVPRRGFFGPNFKKTTMFYEAKIQLYANNVPTRSEED